MRQIQVLFIVENSYYPRDSRVYNECSSLQQNKGFNCHVFAPRNHKEKEKFFEKVEGVSCIRYPTYESTSFWDILIEYAIAFFWFVFVVPLIVVFKKIKIIHVGNPPDFVIPAFFWLKLFGVKFVFDRHDLTIEQFNMRIKHKGLIKSFLLSLLQFFEWASIKLSDLIITTNETILEHDNVISSKHNKVIVRNSNRIQFLSIEDIQKTKNQKLTLGYFGHLCYHGEAGIQSLEGLAEDLKSRGIDFCFSIIGGGPGLNTLQNSLKEKGLEDFFIFHGWMRPQQAFRKILQFDYGILPWTICDGNNFHTAAKLMDYMCCGVPVCTLHLVEQLRTTNGIGIHSDTFDKMVEDILINYSNTNAYETLRAHTLKRFNQDLCWEKQEIRLLSGYRRFVLAD